MNAHLVRHLAAKLYLEEHPGDYGTVKLLLGHKDIGSTINAYCGTESDAAYLVYDAMIADKQAKGGVAGGRKGLARGRS